MAAAAGAACTIGAAWAAATCMAIRGWRLMRTDSSPSEISNSEMPEYSSSSITFFTLRISIRDSLEEPLVLGFWLAGACGFELELIADGSQSDDAADRDVG